MLDGFLGMSGDWWYGLLCGFIFSAMIAACIRGAKPAVYHFQGMRNDQGSPPDQTLP